MNLGAEREWKENGNDRRRLSQYKHPNDIVSEVVQAAKEDAPSKEVHIDGQLSEAHSKENGREKLTIAAQHLTADFVVLSQLITHN